MRGRNLICTMHSWLRGAGLLGVFMSMLFLSGCPNIWNAGDLAVWVKDRAAEQGCVRETITLADWYVQTAEGSVWRGTCRDAQGVPKTFGINVDSVWTPSEAVK